jgi:phage baseplate assembly protein W
MTTFIGFNTINQYKKFTIVDFDLIKQDLLNAFNIRQGELVGRPGYGTTLWNFIFENQTQESIQGISNEIERVAGGDPRVFIQSIEVFPQQNGILVQVAISTVQGQTAQLLSVFFDQQSRRASYV